MICHNYIFWILPYDLCIVEDLNASDMKCPCKKKEEYINSCLLDIEH